MTLAASLDMRILAFDRSPLRHFTLDPNVITSEFPDKRRKGSGRSHPLCYRLSQPGLATDVGAGDS